jgi:surface antigen
VVRTSLPLLGLATLATQGLLHGPSAPVTLVGQGRGTVAALDAGRVVTDGHPSVVVLPVRRVAPAAVPAPARERVRTTAGTGDRAAAGPRRHLAAVPKAKQVRVTDGYPWASDTTQASDPWGFTKRQCVSYAAWRLAQAGRPLDNATQHWGSALDWDDTARRLGRRVSSTPTVGAVAQWNAGERSSYWSPGASSPDGRYVAGPAGHVAWVVQVYGDGSVLVAQYNGMGDRAFSTMHVTAPRYLTL